jgi:hypothetical protein
MPHAIAAKAATNGVAIAAGTLRDGTVQVTIAPTHAAIPAATSAASAALDSSGGLDAEGFTSSGGA